MRRIRKAGAGMLVVLSGIIMLAGCKGKTEKISAEWSKEGESAVMNYDNAYMMRGLMTQSEKGCCYTESVSTGDGYNLYFWDKQLKKTTILCNESGCKHKGDTCTSYLSGNVSPCVQYYGGYIYYIVKDDQENKLLYKMSELGDRRTEVMTLCSKDEGYECSIWMNEQYLVYSILNNKATQETIYIVDMQTNVKQNIGAYDGSRIGDIKFTADGFVFDVLESKADHTAYYKYVYGEEKAQSIINRKSTGGSYTLDGEKLYYPEQGIIHQYDIQTAQDIEWSQYSGYCYLSYDSDYIYAGIIDKDGTSGIHIYHKNGDLIEELLYSDQMKQKNCVHVFGSGEYLFVRVYEAKNPVYYYYDKSAIGSDGGEWKRFVKI